MYNDGTMEPFDIDKPFVGMIHLLPLPGSVDYDGKGLAPILDAALQDLRALETGGADAALVENLRDAPLSKTAAKETITAMTVIVQEITRKAHIPIGVNVLRNDAAAALAIAAATGALFIRVNVFCGVAFSDQGLIEGQAHALLELRKRLGCDVKILADVHVKHAAHPTTIEEAAIDATRNHPDGLIVSGIGTGKRTTPEDLQTVKQATPLPVLVGSGVRMDNLSTFREADGFIVGISLKENGMLDASIDPQRVCALAGAIAGLRQSK